MTVQELLHAIAENARALETDIVFETDEGIVYNIDSMPPGANIFGQLILTGPLA